MRTKVLLSISVIVIMILSGCTEVSVANDFTEKPIENGFNNFLAGGRIAYCSDGLYIVGQSEILKVDNKKCSEVYSLKNRGLYPVWFYNYNDTFYEFFNKEYLREYDKDSSAFVKSDIKVKPSNFYYLSDDLLIYYDNDKLVIDYKGSINKIDYEISNFYPVDNYVYLLAGDDEIYRYNLEKPDEKPELLYVIRNGSASDVFMVLGDYIYYDYCSDDAETKDGLCRYSLKNKKSEYVTENTVSKVNAYKDIFYYIADNTLYYLNDDETQKVCDINADEVYIVDEKWIYIFDGDKLYRTNHSGNIIEKVEF